MIEYVQGSGIWASGYHGLTVAEVNTRIDQALRYVRKSRIVAPVVGDLVDHLHARELETDQAHGEALAIQAELDKHVDFSLSMLTVTDLNDLIDLTVSERPAREHMDQLHMLANHLNTRKTKTDRAHGEALAIQAQMALVALHSHALPLLTEYTRRILSGVDVPLDAYLPTTPCTLVTVHPAADTLQWANAVTDRGSRVQRAFAKGYRFTAYGDGRLVVSHVGTGNPLDGTVVAHYDLADQDAAKRTAADYADALDG